VSVADFASAILGVTTGSTASSKVTGVGSLLSYGSPLLSGSTLEPS